MSELDEADLVEIIEKIIPMAPQIGTLISDQIRNGKCGDPRRRRWHKSVISWALALWARLVFKIFLVVLSIKFYSEIVTKVQGIMK